MKFMYHQQLHKMRLDCPICRTGVLLEEEEEPVENFQIILVDEERIRIKEYINKSLCFICMLVILYELFFSYRV